jgi:elongation factor 1-alpha
LDHPSVITAGYTPVVHTHTGPTACTIETIEKKVDVETEKMIDENPDFLQSGEAAVVIFEPQKPLSVEPITKTPELGLFAVRDMGQTIAVGAVTAIEAP